MFRARSAASVAARIFGLCVLTLAAPALALPPGRAWAPAEPIEFPGAVFMGSPRLETDDDGVPLLIAGTHWDTSGVGLAWNVFAFQGSGWKNVIASDVPSFYLAEPALSLVSRRHVVWYGAEDPAGYLRVLLAEVLRDRITNPDTAMTTTFQDFEYAAAVSARRRWVARSHQFPGDVLRLTVVFSDTAGRWHELPRLGEGSDHLTIAPLSDTSAMLVHAGEPGLAWAVVEGDRWTQAGNIDPRRMVAAHPRFRFRPSGGFWLLWTERLRVHVSSYQDGKWSRGDSLTAYHPDGHTYLAGWCDLSRDRAERPVLAWGDFGITTARSVGCVAFPTGMGWERGEEIPGSENIFTTPFVAVDRNGDLWAAWRLFRIPLNRFTHTYVSATASPPQVTEAGRHRTLAWTLSEPAPGSWWTVQRAGGYLPRAEGGPPRAPVDEQFEDLSRVQAGEGTEMTWTDPSPPGGVLRYRVRRDCVDKRYEWLSEEASWPPQSRKPRAIRLIARGTGIGTEFEVSDAKPGELEVWVFDVHGRRVHRQLEPAADREARTFRLGLDAHGGGLQPGVYFVRARDALGFESNAVKTVVLR